MYNMVTVVDNTVLYISNLLGVEIVFSGKNKGNYVRQ